MKNVEDNAESTAFLEAIKEFETSLGCSLREYNSSKNAQESTQKSLNQKEEGY
jgi:hypothetical protein